jgi:hypothetical protein
MSYSLKLEKYASKNEKLIGGGCDVNKKGTYVFFTLSEVENILDKQKAKGQKITFNSLSSIAPGFVVKVDPKSTDGKVKLSDCPAPFEKFIANNAIFQGCLIPPITSFIVLPTAPTDDVRTKLQEKMDSLTKVDDCRRALAFEDIRKLNGIKDAFLKAVEKYMQKVSITESQTLKGAIKKINETKESLQEKANEIKTQLTQLMIQNNDTDPNLVKVRDNLKLAIVFNVTENTFRIEKLI